MAGKMGEGGDSWQVCATSSAQTYRPGSASAVLLAEPSTHTHTASRIKSLERVPYIFIYTTLHILTSRKKVIYLILLLFTF
jgi:hypothetical protein